MNNQDWYMVRVATNKEEAAIENFKREVSYNNLEGFVSEYHFPKEKKLFMRNGKRVESKKAMFPGYILVKMNPTGEVIRLVRTTNYLVEIMGNSGKPHPITQSEVNRIFGNIEESNNKVRFIEGEEVEIISGPFKGFKASIKTIDQNKQKVELEVLVFSQPTKVYVGYNDIDKL